MIAQHPNPCNHKYQDEVYGKGFRVMNPVYENGKLAGGRCTVCSPPKAKGTKRGGVFTLSQLRFK